MANGYDGFNVAMGLFADTFDEDEAKRKEGRQERTAIRTEGRADTRLKDQESRLEGRAMRLEDRISDRAIAKRDEERNFTARNDENIKLIQLKDASAALGLDFEGKDRHELIRQNAVAMSNLGAWGWFMTNKQYIDELPPEMSEAAYQEVLGISGPLDLESLKEQPNEKLLELKARIQTPVESIAQTRAEDRIRKMPGYKKELERVNKISGIIGRGAFDAITPTISAMEAGDEEATAAHLEVMGRLVNDQVFRDIVNESAGLPDIDDKGGIRTQLMLQNPTAFFGRAYDSRGTGKGMGFMSHEDGLRLSGMYDLARDDARGDLTDQAASGKVMTKDNTAALAWLNKELEFVEGNKDKKSQRETFISLLPSMLEELSSAMDSKTLEGSLLREDMHSWVNELSQQNQRQVEQGGGQPRLGQPRRPELPGIGQGQRREGQPFNIGEDYEQYEDQRPPDQRPPLPQPIAPPSISQAKGKGEINLDDPDYNVALEILFGDDKTPSWWMMNSKSLSPEEVLGGAIEELSRRRSKTRSAINYMGARRPTGPGGDITIDPKGYGYDTGSLVLEGEPSGSTEYFKSLSQLKEDRAAAPGLWQTWDEQESTITRLKRKLEILKGQAESQTGARIPGLGSGQRQQ